MCRENRLFCQKVSPYPLNLAFYWTRYMRNRYMQPLSGTHLSHITRSACTCIRNFEAVVQMRTKSSVPYYKSFPMLLSLCNKAELDANQICRCLEWYNWNPSLKMLWFEYRWLHIEQSLLGCNTTFFKLWVDVTLLKV